MILVYLTQDPLAKCRAKRLNGNLVDCQLIDGKPDPTNTHREIRERAAAGEKIEVVPYPNEYFPAPPSDEDLAAQAAAERVAQYREIAIAKLAQAEAEAAEDTEAAAVIQAQVAPMQTAVSAAVGAVKLKASPVEP